MKPYLTLIFMLFGAFFGYAQDMSPRVTNMAGFDLDASDIIITVSIGEAAISTLANNELAITQGFLQPEIIPCEDISLNYYPNPAKKDITVEANGCDAVVEEVQVLDLWGRLISSAAPDENHKVSLENLSQGMYILKLILNNNTVSNINIIKVAN